MDISDEVSAAMVDAAMRMPVRSVELAARGLCALYCGQLLAIFHEFSFEVNRHLVRGVTIEDALQRTARRAS